MVRYVSTHNFQLISVFYRKAGRILHCGIEMRLPPTHEARGSIRSKRNVFSWEILIRKVLRSRGAVWVLRHREIFLMVQDKFSFSCFHLCYYHGTATKEAKEGSKGPRIKNRRQTTMARNWRGANMTEQPQGEMAQEVRSTLCQPPTVWNTIRKSLNLRV